MRLSSSHWHCNVRRTVHLERCFDDVSELSEAQLREDAAALSSKTTTGWSTCGRSLSIVCQLATPLRGVQKALDTDSLKTGDAFLKRPASKKLHTKDRADKIRSRMSLSDNTGAPWWTAWGLVADRPALGRLSMQLAADQARSSAGRSSAVDKTEHRFVRAA